MPSTGIIAATNDKLDTVNPSAIADKTYMITTPIESKCPDFLSSLSVRVLEVC
ncbi:MAG TPA: hypothetical protein VFV86_05095 [Nitrososphaeraceae archaeon]|nr:hypothetical protein [Nitrososphaeraceae archaeon]